MKCPLDDFEQRRSVVAVKLKIVKVQGCKKQEDHFGSYCNYPDERITQTRSEVMKKGPILGIF